MKVLIVDDQVLFREGLVGLINSQPNMAVVGEAGSAVEAVEKAGELKPDVILMDYNLPDGSGADAARMILKEQPKMNILFLTVMDSDAFLFSAIRSGARGYLLKDMPFAELIQSIRNAGQGQPVLSPRMTLKLMSELAHPTNEGSQEASDVSNLTTREVEILKLIGDNASNQEISEAMYISISTVKNHLHKLFIKLGLPNRQEVARYARRNGLRRSKASD